MKNNRNKVQFTLIFVGLFLILATYIFYPIITKNKVTEKDVVKNEKTDLDDTIQNTFEEIEYNGIYNLNNPFVITSGDAYILKENLDIIYMSDMKATINMKDGRVIIITSDSGRYNKISYDCFFENNVRSFDGETTLVSDKSRVYKGGSWKDRAYWLVAGNRRYLDEDKSTDAIGFRCAMDRVGSPTGFNYGRKKKKKK